MSVTVVNEWWFKQDADIEKGKKVASELVDDFNNNWSSVQLSLWIEDRSDPLHHFHITVFDDIEAVMQIRESEGIQRFIEKFWPLIVRDETYKSPACDVWLCDTNNIKKIRQEQ